MLHKVEADGLEGRGQEPDATRKMRNPIIQVEGLTKRFGGLTAVDDVSFTVKPGKVTGFLGPNGAGKTTTIRMILGLAHPTRGSAHIGGRRYAELEDPTRVVGALLDDAQPHPGRTARNHLRVLAAERDLPGSRVEETLRLVDLEAAADRRAGEFSLGMRQRLGLAAALLTDPQLLILDEPANGLDPAGTRWLREFLRSLAASGRSVFVSSHQLAEVSQMAEEVIVLDRGKLLTQRDVADLVSGRVGASVRTPQADRLSRALRDAGAESMLVEPNLLMVNDLTTARVGEVAAHEGVVLHELTPHLDSLEDVFLRLTTAEGDR